MSEQKKKILLVASFIIITLAIAFAIYYLFFRPFLVPEAPPRVVINRPPAEIIGFPEILPAINIPPTALPAVNVAPEIPPEIPVIPPTPAAIPGPEFSFEARGGLTSFETLESNRSLSPTLSANGQDIIYYDPNTGFFHSVTPTGEKKFFSDKSFKNVEKITWSPNNKKAVLEYPDGSNVVHDFKLGTTTTLPAHWKDFSFSSNSDNITFKSMRVDPENRYLAVVDSKGTSYRQIERIGREDKNVHVTWSPNDKYAALYIKPLDGDRSEIFPIGFNSENFKKFRVEGRDLRFKWTPNADKLVYSVYNSRSNYKPSLWVVNTSPKLLGTRRINLGVQTWADKCTVASSSIIYCAVPTSLDTGIGFLPSLADNTPDEFFKINISTNTKELIAEPMFPTTVDQLFISEDNQFLFWIEKNSGQIKKLNL